MKPNKKLLILRILFAVLTIATMVFIFLNSADNAAASTKKSDFVCEMVAPVVVPNYKNLTDDEKLAAILKLVPPVRTLAHFTEFALLGLFSALFLSTFSLKSWVRFFAVLLFCFLYALSDEYHQSFTDGRASEWTDIFIDTLGALLADCFVLLTVHLLKKKKSKSEN